MARDFEIDLTPLTEAIRHTPDAVGRGARRGLDIYKDEWVLKGRNIAPLNIEDGGNLRRQMNGKLHGAGLESNVIITANAYSKTGNKTFNYPYYIHEGHMAADGKSLRHPGTVEEFLDDSADEVKLKQTLEEEIKEELRRGGW